MKSHWFSSWFCTVTQQPIPRANVDLDLCRHMASPGHNALIIIHDINIIICYFWWKWIKNGIACTTKIEVSSKNNIIQGCVFLWARKADNVTRTMFAQTHYHIQTHVLNKPTIMRNPPVWEPALDLNHKGLRRCQWPDASWWPTSVSTKAYCNHMQTDFRLVWAEPYTKAVAPVGNRS